MDVESQKNKRNNIVIISSSHNNLAKLLALNNQNYNIFLIIDKRIPHDIEDEELDNFYVYSFNKQKLYDKDKEKYFDNLAIFITTFEPDVIITNNFTKYLSQSFIEFVSFTRPNANILSITHGDSNHEELFGGIKEFMENGTISSKIYSINKKEEIMTTTKSTTLKELKQKKLIHKKEEIINYRIQNVVKSYHERTKVLKPLQKTLESLFKQ